MNKLEEKLYNFWDFVFEKNRNGERDLIKKLEGKLEIKFKFDDIGNDIYNKEKIEEKLLKEKEILDCFGG